MRPWARWLLSLTLIALVLAVWPGRAPAHPLDPTRFTLGTPDLLWWGAYVGHATTMVQ